MCRSRIIYGSPDISCREYYYADRVSVLERRRVRPCVCPSVPWQRARQQQSGAVAGDAHRRLIMTRGPHKFWLGCSTYLSVVDCDERRAMSSDVGREFDSGVQSSRCCRQVRAGRRQQKVRLTRITQDGRPKN